jgi:Tfp pilus assembly protein PilF
MIILLSILFIQVSADQNNLEEGINFYQEGLYPEAVKLLREAINNDPLSYDAHYYLGLTYYKIKLNNDH